MKKHQLTPEGKKTFRDLVRFGRHLVASKDIDPLYPVLRYLQKDLEYEQAVWHTFLYVAWYNLSSAQSMFDRYPDPNPRILKRIQTAQRQLPTGTERRASRGGKVALHLASYMDTLKNYQNHIDYYRKGITPWPLIPKSETEKHLHDNWQHMNSRLQELYLNGRWAAYKHLEVLRRVNHMPFTAPDMGHQFSSGPREGLAMLYGEVPGQDASTIALLDSQGVDLQRRLAERGLKMDIEEVETLLCNWKSTVKGKYYVGHDIDEFQEQIDKAKAEGFLRNEQARALYEARQASLPNQYLGELNGWRGVDKSRSKAYRDRGKILIRKEK